MHDNHTGSMHINSIYNIQKSVTIVIYISSTTNTKELLLLLTLLITNTTYYYLYYYNNNNTTTTITTTTILPQPSPIRVSSDVLIDALHPNLNTRATVREHLVQMRLQAVVGTGLDRDADALGSVYCNNSNSDMDVGVVS